MNTDIYVHRLSPETFLISENFAMHMGISLHAFAASFRYLEAEN